MVNKTSFNSLISDSIVSNFLEKSNKRVVVNPSREEFFSMNFSRYSEKISSLVRILSFEEICGCIYIDKEENVWFSTNLNKSVGGSFKYSIISNYFISKFSSNKKESKEKAEEDFIRKIFLEGNPCFNKLEKIYGSLLDVTVKKIEKKAKEIKLERTEKEQYLQIIEKIKNNFFYYNSDNKIYGDILKDFNILKTGIDKFLENLLSKNFEKIPLDKKDMKLISSVALYIEDFLNIYNFSEDKKYELIIINAFRKNEIKKAECRNGRNVHCEQRMLEHISNHISEGKITRNFYSEVELAIEEGRFVISKFCCGNCSLVFGSFSEKISGNSLIVNKLGNTRSFFKSWKSPCFMCNYEIIEKLEKDQEVLLVSSEKIEDFNRLFFLIRKHIMQEMSELKCCYNMDELTEPFIENSETEELVNNHLNNIDWH